MCHDTGHVAIRRGLAEAHAALGDLDAALDRIRTLLEIDPGFWLAYYLRGAMMMARGKIREALQDFEECVRLSGGAPYAVGLRIHALAAAGERDPAERELHALLEAATKGYVPALSLAVAYLGLGNLDRVFHWLDRSVAERDIFTRFYIRYDPMFAPLRHDPRTIAVFNRMGFPAR